MAYFIHNKYDKNSIAALALIDKSANTVIDYYGNYDTYKYLDVSAGFGKLYDALSYITPNTTVFDDVITDGKSYFNFSSSIIIKSIQRGNVDVDADADVTVNISTIDASKSVIIFASAESIRGSNTGTCGYYLVSLDNTSFTLHGRGMDASNVSYQIIEYY